MQDDSPSPATATTATTATTTITTTATEQQEREHERDPAFVLLVVPGRAADASETNEDAKKDDANRSRRYKARRPVQAKTLVRRLGAIVPGATDVGVEPCLVDAATKRVYHATEAGVFDLPSDRREFLVMFRRPKSSSSSSTTSSSPSASSSSSPSASSSSHPLPVQGTTSSTSTSVVHATATAVEDAKDAKRIPEPHEAKGPEGAPEEEGEREEEEEEEFEVVHEDDLAGMDELSVANTNRVGYVEMVLNWSATPENWTQAAEVVADVVQRNASHLLSETVELASYAYATTRNPLTNYFTSVEQDQMRRIHAAYLRCFAATELPPELQMEDNFLRPRWAVSPLNFKKESWMKRFGSEYLRADAEAMVSVVCAYQEERHERNRGGGYVDDPRNLVLEHLKQWAVSKVSEMKPTPPLLAEVNKMIEYLNELLRAGLFPPGQASQTTMEQTLLRVRTMLEEKVRVLVEQEIKNISVRELLENLTKDCRSALYHGILFLLYILSDMRIPQDVTLDHLRNPDSAPFREVTSTEAGKLLQSILRHERIAAIFFPAAAPATSLSSSSSSSSSASSPSSTKPTAALLPPFAVTKQIAAESAEDDSGGKKSMTSAVEETSASSSSSLLFPSVALLRWIPDSKAVVQSTAGNNSGKTSSKVRVLPQVDGNALITANYASGTASCRSGICRSLCSASSLASFVQLHALLFELGGFLGLLYQAKVLAGLGGELLVFGYSNAQITRLLEQFCTLVQQVLERTASLERACQRHQAVLIQQRSQADSGWIRNYNTAAQQGAEMKKELGNAFDTATKVRGLAGTSLQDRVKEAQEATRRFVSDSAAFTATVHAALLCFDPAESSASSAAAATAIENQ